jgi:F0F1-type ATP synthase assembly protein I
MIQESVRKAASRFIPGLTIAVLFGFTDSFAKINEPLMNTSLTLGMIVAALNIFLL